MHLLLITVMLLSLWTILVLMGKGGFVHLLLLNGLGIAAVVLMIELRKRVRIDDLGQTSGGGEASEGQ